ncbi:hypothetical protein M8818_007084 [Zalaria obscura]|uniref:Uncharacterized protein n=1 Tax=Zalaria obscura TaxID=2024903 RepID=A0ACC3S3Z5_9PEZI
MRVLRELNIKIHDAVVDRGFVCKVFKFQTPNGWTLGTSRTGDQGHPEEFCVATSRHAIQQCLAEAIPKEVIQYAEVKLVLVEHGKKPVVVLADGAEHRADLVIGADGVRSAVKSGVFDAEDAKLYAPVYSYVCSGLGYLMEINLPRRGSCGVGGFLQTQLPEHLLREQSMTFTFGRSGSFGYAPVNSHSGDQLLWWSSYESEAPPRKREIDPNHIRRMLQARHQGWWDPLITTVLYNAKVDTVWPTWTLPDLPYWGRDGCVLVGDAAHALNPASGQGVSQALEDAATLPLLLAGYLRQNTTDPERAIALSIKGFYEIRKDRVKGFAETAKKVGSPKVRPSFIAQLGLYILMWAVTHLSWFGKLAFGDLLKIYSWRASAEVERKLAEKPNMD